jgi:dimethylaniline monooxygenase (N-oxide forming)
MHEPDSSIKTGGRLSGEDVRRYMEDFAKQFLNGKIRFETEILNIRRGDHCRGWNVLVHDKSTGAEKVLYYSRIVLCTGVSSVHILDSKTTHHDYQGCSKPHYPELLTPAAAKLAQFSGPVLHSMHFRSHIDDLLSCTPPVDPRAVPMAPIIVIGGGRSAQE